MQLAGLGQRGWCISRGTVLAAVLLSLPAARAQEKLETPQQTNERIRQLSAAAQVRQAEYLIGSGDLLAIEVFDVKELSREVRVNESGTIALPLLPVRLHVAGLSETQVEQKLTEVLEANGLVSHPQVSVAVKEKKSKPITVIGAVGHPMVFQAVRQVTLLEVLSEAGGIANDAGSTVIVTRQVSDPSSNSDAPAPAAPGEAALPALPPLTLTINLNDLLESGDAKYNIALQGGDVVSIPRAGIVYVMGAVDRPGGFVLSNDREQMSALKVLALAGGFRRTARPEQAVILRKNGSNGQQREVAVDLKKVMQRKIEDVRLYPSDILLIPESGGKRAALKAGEIALALGSGVTLFRLSR